MRQKWNISAELSRQNVAGVESHNKMAVQAAEVIHYSSIKRLMTRAGAWIMMTLTMMVHTSLSHGQLGMLILLDVARRQKKEHIKVVQMGILTTKIEILPEAGEEATEEGVAEIGDVEIEGEAEGDIKTDGEAAVATLFLHRVAQIIHNRPRIPAQVKTSRPNFNHKEEAFIYPLKLLPASPLLDIIMQRTHLINHSSQHGHSPHLHNISSPSQICQICQTCGQLCPLKRLCTAVLSLTQRSLEMHKEVRQINGTLKANRMEEVEVVRNFQLRVV